MNQEEINNLAQHLYDAELNKKAIEKITVSNKPDLSIEEAYQIQQQLNKLRIANGHRVFAPKLGLTSPAKMKQMNVEHPIYGYVFYSMLVSNNKEFSIHDYIQPRVEPEISVILKNELRGPGITLQDVEDNLDYVVSSVEVLDSRYKNYEFTLPDVIADNTSAKGAVYSNEQVRLEPKDLISEEARLSINGEVKAEGNGAAVLGNPLETIVFLANEMGKAGESVPANTPIMTGGMTAAVKIKPGDLIEVEFSTLGKIEIRAIS